MVYDYNIFNESISNFWVFYVHVLAKGILILADVILASVARQFGLLLLNLLFFCHCSLWRYHRFQPFIVYCNLNPAVCDFKYRNIFSVTVCWNVYFWLVKHFWKYHKGKLIYVFPVHIVLKTKLEIISNSLSRLKDKHCCVGSLRKGMPDHKISILLRTTFELFSVFNKIQLLMDSAMSCIWFV